MRMRRRSPVTTSTGVLVAAAVVAFTTAAVAQQRPAQHYSTPRTPDGQPDLQGYWTNLTYTPFERPKELADKPFYTEQEAIDAFNKAAQVSLTTNQILGLALVFAGITLGQVRWTLSSGAARCDTGS